MSCFLIFAFFVLRLKLNLMFLVIMPKNICQHLFKLIWFTMASFIKLHTPSQNGVAERKNNHLFETTRALLFHMNVPKPFWVDAVSTTCFLINCIPSSVLYGDTPYSILFPTKSLFPIALRIFGSTCFVQDVCSHVTKLDPKSLKCISLGYSRL